MVVMVDKPMNLLKGEWGGGWVVRQSVAWLGVLKDAHIMKTFSSLIS